MVQVGCAGILVVDTFAGPLQALPREGQLVTTDSISATVGGCASNVASALAKQGLEAGVAGCAGADHSAQLLRDELLSRDVDCRQLLTTTDYPTSQTVVLTVEGQDRRFIHVFGANEAFAVDKIDRQWVANLRLFYVGGLFGMPNFSCHELAELLKFCRQNHVRTALDVVVPEGFADFHGLDSCLPHCDFFLPNDYEAEALSGQPDSLDQAKYFRDRGVGTTVISLGDRGAVALRESDFWRVPAFKFSMVDGTGCGDAFAAGLIAGVLRHGDLPESLVYASALGGSCAQRRGAYEGVFTAEQVDVFLENHALDLQRQTV